MVPRILCFAGSARADSLNKKLARAAATLVDEAGGGATFLDLRDLPLPLYDGDLEAAQGLPENARVLKRLCVEHHGLLVATAEYNGSVTPLLKNAIDWVSRPDGTQAGSVPYAGKAAALLAASPGALGGLRALVHVRQILTNLGVLVIPQQHALARADSAFDAAGALADPKQREAVANVARALVGLCARIAA